MTPNTVCINVPYDLMFCVAVYQFRWTGAVFLFGSQYLEGLVTSISNRARAFFPTLYSVDGQLVILTLDLEGNGCVVAGQQWLRNNLGSGA